MPETTESTPVINSRRIVEECVEFARRNGAGTPEIDQFDQRAWPRMLFTHQLRYCPSSKLSEDHTKPAKMLDISLGGMGLWCCEALAEGTVIHVRLPLLDGKIAWVRGRVMYCQPEVEHYQAGLAFILDQD